MFIHFPSDLAKNAAVASASFCFVFSPLCVCVRLYMLSTFLSFWVLVFIFYFFGSLNMKSGPNDILSWHHVFLFPDIKQAGRHFNIVTSDVIVSGWK